MRTLNFAINKLKTKKKKKQCVDCVQFDYVSDGIKLESLRVNVFNSTCYTTRCIESLD